MNHPEDPASDPIAARIRSGRIAAGLSLRDLADLATRCLLADDRPGRSRSVSASYLSLIETGAKVPDAAIARAIAMALGDDETLFLAWVAARKRSDLPTVLAAVNRLGPLISTASAHDADRRALPAPAGGVTRHARLRVPRIAAGEDPGPSRRPECPILGSVRVDLEAIPAALRERIDRPVAWRLSAADAHHAGPPYRADGLVLLLRDFQAVTRDHAFALRWNGRVTPRRMVWNGARLLLLPPESETHFEVIDAAEPRLRSLVLGLLLPLDETQAEAS